MNAIPEIRLFLRKARLCVFLSLLFKGMSRAIPLLVSSCLLLSGFDQWLVMESWVRETVWIAMLLLAGALALHAFLPLTLFSIKEQSKNLWRNRSREQGSGELLRRDTLFLAVQLSSQTERPGLSSGLREEYLREAASTVKQQRPWACCPRWMWRRALAVNSLVVIVAGSLWAAFPHVFPLTPRIYFPFSTSPLESCLRVNPGSANVEWGQDAVIQVTLLCPSIERPQLAIKAHRDWTVFEPESVSANHSFFRLRNLVEPVSYKVRWKKEWSPRYVLRPMKPLQLKKAELIVTPPSYLKKAASHQSSLELSGLAGTQVHMTLDFSMPVAKALVQFSDGRERLGTVSNNSVDVAFLLEKSGTYRFALDLQNGRPGLGVGEFPIHVQADSPPVIHLLSPSDDVIVGDKEKLPLTFDASDDYGVSEVRLMWEKSGGLSGSKQVAFFDPPRETVLSTVEWDLGGEKFRPGDVIQIRLEAVDANVVTGPGKSLTPWRLIEIASFEKTHAALESVLEEWRGKAVDLLADVNTLKASVDSSSASLRSLMEPLNKAMSDSLGLEKSLQRLVNQMEKDPMADYGVWLEHKSIQGNLSAMNAGPMKYSEAAFQTDNKAAASFHLSDVSSELERMVALSHKLSKDQKARDVVEAGDRLQEAGEQLLKEFSAAPDLKNKDVMAKINDLINEAQRTLADMARAVQQMPQELPDDFINQEGVKTLNLQESQDVLSQIAEALKQGDTKKALSLAQKFLEAAKKMKSQLSKAYDSFVEENSASELSKKITEQEAELNAVIDEERTLLSKTQELETRRLSALMKEQETLLGQLAKRQARLIERTHSFANKPAVPAGPAALLRNQIAPLQGVLHEMETGRLKEGVGVLEGVVRQMGLASDGIKASSAPVSLQPEAESLEKDEREILELLRKSPPPKGLFSSGDLGAFPGLENKQTDLSKRTAALKKNLQALSQKTASLGISMTQSLSNAKGEMDKASRHLGSFESHEAQSSEENALRHLQNTQDALGEAQNQMGGMSMRRKGGAGGALGGPKVIWRGSSRNGQGLDQGPVKLPRLEDYRPPREFREELLEALKEKYPKAYEQIIQKYYKRLSD